MSDPIEQLKRFINLLMPIENNHASNFYQDSPDYKDLHLGNWFDKGIDFYLSLGGILPFVDSCARVGCYLTALANAFKNFNIKIDGKVSDVKVLFHFFNSKNLFTWNGEFLTYGLSQHSDVNIYSVPKEIMNTDPLVLNDILKKGGEIIIKMKSPTGRDGFHFVNVNEYIQETVGDATMFFAMIKETKKEFETKYSQKIEINEKVMDTRVLLRKDQLTEEADGINPLKKMEYKKNN